MLFNQILASLNLFHTDCEVNHSTIKIKDPDQTYPIFYNCVLNQRVNDFENLNKEPSSEVINHPQSPNVLADNFYKDTHKIIEKGLDSSRNHVPRDLSKHFKELKEKYS